MEQFKAAVSTFISGTASVVAWISLQNAKDLAALFASVIAALSGYFAIRYYYYATKEKKLSIKSKTKQ